jgi:hypothetical protein
MSNALDINTETAVNENGSLGFYCSVALSDKEQIIIAVEETEGQWVNGNYTMVKTGEVNKYRLESLYYGKSYEQGDNGIYLSSLTIRGFRKDGHLRFRSETLYTARLTKEVIEQIPDEYHNYAREAFAKSMVELQEELINMTNKGVQIVCAKTI